MPFIFPRRFLRNKDILSPKELTEDLSPVTDLLASGLDRHNFKGAALKENLSAVSTADVTSVITAESPVRVVAKYAYHQVHHVNNECKYYMDRSTALNSNSTRSPPNFVEPDGVTFRDDRSGSTSDAKPFVIPHTGEWSAVRDANLTDSLKVEFSTLGESTLYLCAYFQYIWQGFYEYKSPWIKNSAAKGQQNEFTSADIPSSDVRWVEPFGADEIARKEAEVLNHFGPISDVNDYEAFVSDSSSDMIPATTGLRYPYSFPLNELTAKAERSFPGLGGQHHISRGFYPALVQFALRVDGKIIEETITGKHHQFEESAHGLQIDDSPLFSFSASAGAKNYKYKTAQRSSGYNARYGKADSKSVAGQKIAGSRATSCGPEVMPIRIGCTIPLSEGNHTVEIVARRLDRKKRAFTSGDFVGVFSRRILAIELTKLGANTDTAEFTASSSPPSVAYESEDVVKESSNSSPSVRLARQFQAHRLNDIHSSEIRRHSLPHTHLPSKVAFSDSVSITGTYTRVEGSGLWSPGSMTAPSTTATRFPGFKNTGFINKRYMASPDTGWKEEAYADGAGWRMITSSDSVSSDSYKSLKITSDELGGINTSSTLILMADIEVKWIRGLLSDKARAALDSGADDVLNTYVSYLQDGKYLDLFALFAIGYRTGESDSSWVIADPTVPGMVNSFNWTNRSENFLAERTVGDVKISKAYAVTDSSTGSEYSFSTPKYAVDRRGGNTFDSNMGCNIPLMLVLKTPITIKEVAVFASTTFPSDWDYRVATYGSDSLGDGRDHPISGDFVEDAWASPAFGRGILKGVEVCWGNCSLSALKLND